MLGARGTAPTLVSLLSPEALVSILQRDRIERKCVCVHVCVCACVEGDFKEPAQVTRRVGVSGQAESQTQAGFLYHHLEAKSLLLRETFVFLLLRFSADQMRPIQIFEDNFLYLNQLLNLQNTSTAQTGPAA